MNEEKYNPLLGYRQYPSDGERLARLEGDMESVKEDVSEIKAAVKLISDVFQQARGFKAALWIFGMIVLYGLGVGSRQVFEYLASVLRP